MKPFVFVLELEHQRGKQQKREQSPRGSPCDSMSFTLILLGLTRVVYGIRVDVSVFGTTVGPNFVRQEGASKYTGLLIALLFLI